MPYSSSLEGTACAGSEAVPASEPSVRDVAADRLSRAILTDLPVDAVKGMEFYINFHFHITYHHHINISSK